MNNNIKISQSPTWVIQTLMFFKTHYLIVLALGMAAAMGRVILLPLTLIFNAVFLLWITGRVKN